MRDSIEATGHPTENFMVDTIDASVCKDGVRVALGSKERAVVMALALHGGPLSRERLSDMIHANAGDGGSPESVKVYVHRIRRRTTPAFIVSADGTYELNKSVRVTKTTFRDVASESKDLSCLDAARLETHRLHARKLRAPMPSPMAEYDWFAGVALAHQRSGRQLALDLTRELMARRRFLDAIQIATELTFEDPCDEEAWETVIRCQVSLGQRSAAAHSYRFLSASLQKDLGLQPSFDGYQLLAG
jgi:DNA-binding SARP family transcriptional activator